MVVQSSMSDVSLVVWRELLTYIGIEVNPSALCLLLGMLLQRYGISISAQMVLLFCGRDCFMYSYVLLAWLWFVKLDANMLSLSCRDRAVTLSLRFP